MFNFNKLIRIIKQDETKVFAAADLDFPDFSDSEIVSLLQYAVEQQDEDNYVKIQASKLNENELTPKLLELISSLDPGDFLDKLAKFPSSFRVTNLQLYLPQIARINQKLFDKHNLVFTCNLYFTPDKNHNALPLHRDEGHIFVQQVRGCKS